jgi:PAS domain S-box-containing protein
MVKRKKIIFPIQLLDMMDELRIGVFTVDSNRRITYFNRTAEMITGYTEKDVLGKYCHEVFLNTLCYGNCTYHDAVEEEGATLSFDVEITDANNERLVVTKIVTPIYSSSGRLKGCIEIFQDRSAFEELIRRVRYGERQLKMILDSLDIGIFTVTKSGLITFFNRRLESITGYSREEVIGKSCELLFGKEEKESSALLNQAIETGKPKSRSMGRIRGRNGYWIPVNVNFMALRNNLKKTIGGLVTVQDMTIIQELNRAIKERYTLYDMIGKHPSVQKIFDIIPVIAKSDATVLIEGATGTGKDLLAKVIHNESKRRRRPFVKVNCAAMPDNLLESEMFGYVKGAFTGAHRNKPGRFQEADGGTIFLDEIGDLPLSVQAKLLRVLEDKEFYPLGSRKTTKVDVRIIAATNQGLERLVLEGRFRRDLFYRLNVIRLELPPLSERKEDIPLLIDHILRKISTIRGINIKGISGDAMEILLNYDYPGNIRELENIIEHASIICQGEVIEKRHLPLSLQGKARGLFPGDDYRVNNKKDSEILEKERILNALQKFKWNRGLTAKALKINRSTLWRKMKRYNIIP